MRSVWIDTDMGFDDLVAICMLCGAADVSIEGISLVAGNAELGIVAANADRAASFFGWRAAIYTGRGQPILGSPVTAQYVLGDEGMLSAGRKLPEATISKLMPGAVSKMAESLEQTRSPLTILALGP